MDLSPPIMSDIFSLSKTSSCNLSSGVTVNRRNIKTGRFDLETVSTVGEILWNNVPGELNNAEDLNILK